MELVGLRKIVELQDAGSHGCFQQWPMLLALRERKTMKRKWHFDLRSNLYNYIQNCISVSPQTQKSGSWGDMLISVSFCVLVFFKLGHPCFQPY